MNSSWFEQSKRIGLKSKSNSENRICWVIQKVLMV